MDFLKLDLNKATPDLPTDTEIRFQVALLAVVPELLAQFIFAIAPMWMVEIAVGMLGPFAKHLAFLGCTVIYLIALIAAAIAYLRYAPPRDSAFARYTSPIVFALLIWALTVLV